MHTKFWLENLTGKDHSEDVPRCRSEDTIKLYLRETWLEGVAWIHLAQDRDRWWVLVNTVINLSVHERREIFWLAERTVSFSRSSLKLSPKSGYTMWLIGLHAIAIYTYETETMLEENHTGLLTISNIYSLFTISKYKYFKCSYCVRQHLDMYHFAQSQHSTLASNQII
jgi:hypothetical protein